MDNNENLTFADILRIEGINSKGFGILPKFVMLDTDLTIEAKTIYAYFCSFSGNGTTAFPSREKILYDLQIGKSSFYTHFTKLKDQGYITITKNKDKVTNQFRNNIYTLVSNPKKFELPPNNPEKNDLYSRIYFSGLKSLGYGMIPKAVMIDQRLPIKAKGIYAYFASFTGAGNSAFPKKENILYHLRISENTYYKFYKILTKLNYISSVQRHIGGKLSIKDYYLNDKPDEAKTDSNIVVAVFTQDTENQHRKNQDMANQDTGIQHRKNQDMANQDMGIQHRKNQDMANQDMDTKFTDKSGLLNQYSENQDMANQDMANQDMANQDMANQDMANQDMVNQDMVNQDTNINSPNINNTYYKQSAQSIYLSNTNQHKEREKDRWNDTESNHITEIENEVLRLTVYHTLEIQRAVPYEYNDDPRAMTYAIHYLTSWDIYSGFGMHSEFDQVIYNLFNAALIDMCCKKDKMRIRNAYVTYAMVIDKINEIGNNPSNGSTEFTLTSFMFSAMQDYTKAVENSTIIKNPVAYMQSCIWSRMQSGDIDTYSFMRRDGLI